MNFEGRIIEVVLGTEFSGYYLVRQTNDDNKTKPSDTGYPDIDSDRRDNKTGNKLLQFATSSNSDPLAWSCRGLA